MSSILIKGIEKPKYGYIEIRLYDDRAECEVQEHVYMDYEIEEVPEPHGRLIDADKYIKDNKDIIGCEIDHPRYQDTLRELINDAPTVIEAEGD